MYIVVAALIEVFQVFTHYDNEFNRLMEPLTQEFQIMTNFVEPQEHVPEADRINGVMMERQVRVCHHWIPYTCLSQLMVKRNRPSFPYRMGYPLITVLA